MKKERIILDSKHFMRIQHYRLKTKGKLIKKISLGTIYQKSLKAVSKSVKMIKGQLIQKCIRKLNQLKVEEDFNSINKQENLLRMLKQVDHIYVAKQMLYDLYRNNKKISDTIDCSLHFIDTLPIIPDDENQFITENFININQSNKTGNLIKLKSLLDETENQINDCIRCQELEKVKEIQRNTKSSTSHFHESVSISQYINL